MTPFCKREGNASLEYDLQLAYARKWGGKSYLAGGTGFLLSLGQKEEGVCMIGRLLGPLLQTISFRATTIEERVLANVDFIVQLGTGGSLSLFPEPWFYTPPLSSQMTPFPAFNTGGFVRLHWRG